MTATAPTRPNDRAGRRVERRRYRISAGLRALYAQRIDGKVALFDVPVDHPGRVYLIERHVACMAEMVGICAAYVQHSRQANKPAILAQRELFEDFARALEGFNP